MIRSGKRGFSVEVVWLLALTLGLLLPRIYLASKYRSTLIDSDEAIVGLMARHILQGRWPIFYYGQHYMGSTEAFSTAVLFRLLGATPLAMKVGAFVWFCAFLPVQYLLAREVAGRATARLSTLLLGVSPAFLSGYSIRLMGGYVSLLCLGTLALLLAAKGLSLGMTPARAAILGLTLGLAWWTNFLAIAYILPILLVLTLRFGRKLISPAGLLFLVDGLIGSLPFWIYNIRHAWASFEMRSPLHVGPWEGFVFFFRTALRGFLGTEIFGHAVGFALGLLLFLAAIVLPLRDRWTDLATPSAWDGQLLLLAVLAFFPFLYAASGFGTWTRYLIPLYSVFYILLLSGLGRASLRSGVVAVLLVIHLTGTLRIPVEHVASPLNAEPNGPLLAFLHKEHVRTAYAPYWVAYRLTFEAGEEILTTPPRYSLVRYHPYLEAAEADPASAYIQLNAPRYRKFREPMAVPDGYRLNRVGNFDVWLAP